MDGKGSRCRRLAAATLVLAGTTAFFAATRAEGRNEHARTTARPWWRDAVFYEIYPRSFKDTNGDGIGDLNGITESLDYLADLGIDALWITPFYPSPQADFGYDVSDFENVDPQFGTLADFDRLIREAHRRGLRVIVDMVLNHTSSQHPFFRSARASKASPYRDFYLWRDPDRGGPPNNWYSWAGFSPSAWELDAATGQYYYHTFLVEQPDLNWRNPAVERRMFQSVKFWLDRGVDGFRLDAIDCLVEDARFRDNPIVPERRPGSRDHVQYRRYNLSLPETHAALRRLRALVDARTPPRVLIAETWFQTFEDLMAYYGPHDDEVQLPFNFSLLARVESLDARAFRRQVEDAERALAGRPTTYVLSNHDVSRAISRLGDGVHDEAIGKLLATMLLTLRGAPFLYYGEEIGMVNNDPKRLEDVKDPVGRLNWPQVKGRDGERGPMQWSAKPGAGFTTGRPWLPIGPGAERRNVAAQGGNASSMLAYTKQLLRLRRQSRALREGDYASVGQDPQVFAYRRAAAGETVVVALNLSGSSRTIALPQRSLRVRAGSTRQPGAPIDGNPLALAPYEAVVLEVAGEPKRP